jgi:HSP20 family protein
MTDPFSTFRREMDDLFDSFFSGSRDLEAFADFSPNLDVKETAKQVTMKVDLPGIDEDDIELEIDNDILRLRGERSEEVEDEKEEHRYIERRYGRFERSLRLPFAPGENDVKTDFRKGVLTIRIAKPKNGGKGVKRIPIGRAL